MIRVLVVHELYLVCNALANVLQEEKDIEVVGFAGNAEDAQTQMSDCQCDVVLMNVERPSQEILQFIQNTTRQHRNAKVLLMGVVDAKEFIVQCFQSGAIGYAPRNDSIEELVNRVRAAHRGQTLISPDIAGALVSRVAELSKFVGNISVPGEQGLSMLSNELTPREREVLGFIEKGASNRDIADALTIEVGTVKNHVHSILKKLNVDSRKRAAILARQILPQELLQGNAAQPNGTGIRWGYETRTYAEAQAA